MSFYWENPIGLLIYCRSSTHYKKYLRQHKKRKINNSRAGEILTEKQNESHAIHKRKQISQQTETHQSENQNYRQVSATTEKKNTSQQKFDQIHNVKHHNRKDQEMPNRLPSTFSNAVSRKKKESGPLY